MLIKWIAALFLVSCTQGARELHLAPVTEIPPENNRPETDYLLPDNVKPSAYIITLTPDFETFTFEGEVTITLSADSPTDNITLHYNIINITETTLTGSGDSTVKITSELYEEDTNFYIIKLGSNLTPEEEYKLNIRYKGYLLTDMAGFYRTSYNTSRGETRWLASTQFEATDARRAFPCFDEPKFKATFQLNIIRDNTRRSMNNAELVETVTVNKENGTYKDVFETTPLMSTYLVAFIVSDFESVNLSDGNGRTYKMWAQPELIQDAQFALDISHQIIQYIEYFTGYPYELSKMEQAAIPDFSAGAMENWGLVTYRERQILVNHENASVANERLVATTIAHEFGHQWFSDLVSPAWWKYIWLNEGFATYFEHFAVHAVKPEWNLDEQFIVDAFQNALAVDGVASSHPITTTDVYTPAEINGNFDNIAYDKAGSILRSVEHFLTTDTFKKAIHNYLTKHNHSVAVADELFQAFEEQQQADEILETNLSAVDILKSWTEKAGYPVITVTARQDIKKYHISQTRFLISGSETSDATWYVPLTYTTSDKLDFTSTKPKVWLREGVNEADILDVTVTDGEWIIFNINSTGFYRIQYDEANYKLLTAHLKSENLEQIPTINRAQLIDDSLNLARAGLLNYTIALDLTEYLVNEKHYLPWASFFTAITFLNNRLIGTNLYENFKVYITTLSDNLYKEYSDFNVPEDDTQTNRLNRINILSWACNLDYGTATTEAFRKLEMLLALGHANFHPDLMSVVYCYGLHRGSADDWEKMWERYNTILDPTERNVILNALACTNDTSKLQRLLQASIEDNSGIRSQDSAAVFSAVYSKPEGLDVALEFLDTNFDEIKQYYLAMHILPQVISGIASRISTQEQQVKFVSFYSNHINDFGVVGSAATSAVSTIENNLKWFDTNSITLLQWFAKYTPITTAPTSTNTALSNTNTAPSILASTDPGAASSLAPCLPLGVALLYSIMFLIG